MSAEGYKNYKHLLFELRSNGVLEITLNRPDVLNAWNQAIVDDLVDVWREIERDRAVKVVLITGAGKAFSVGGDVDHLEALSKDAEYCARENLKFTAIMKGMLDLEKPIIAAINGPIVGGGIGVALTSDITLMSDKARILCGSQLNINVVPAEAPYLWPFLTSLAKAKYHIFCSDFIDAATAERIGLVSAVFPDAELMDRARAVADKLASRDTLALGWTKRAMNHWLRMGAPILDLSLSLEAIGYLRPELEDGLEKMRQTIDRKRP